MTEQELKEQLIGSFKNRAMLYWEFYRVLREHFGGAVAAETMKEAIYNRGCAIGERFKSVASHDMEGIKDAFLDFVPGEQGSLFSPELVRCDAEGVDIKFHSCPLKAAWQEAGLSEDEIATLCHIAGRVDNGTFEAAGFAFTADTWKPGDAGCCFLHIRPGPPKP
jgi:hypothetical protein